MEKEELSKLILEDAVFGAARSLKIPRGKSTDFVSGFYEAKMQMIAMKHEDFYKQTVTYNNQQKDK